MSTPQIHLDPFQEFLLATVGRSDVLLYEHIQAISGYKTTQALYNEKHAGRLVPMNADAKKPAFSWRAVKQWMQMIGRWPV
jgi:hypothetical protein